MFNFIKNIFNKDSTTNSNTNESINLTNENSTTTPPSPPTTSITQSPKKPKKPKKLVTQKHNYDSEIASIAMFTGYTYDQIVSEYFPSRNFNNTRIKQVEFKAIMFDLNISVSQTKELDESKDAIVIVPSLNSKDRLHIVYWDSENKELCDPQMGRIVYGRPKKYYTNDTFFKSKHIACFQKEAALPPE